MTRVNVTTAGSPEPIDRDDSDLCLECGICCDGTLFGAIVVHIPEREFVESLGLPVSEDPEYGGFVAPLPCSAFVGGRCALYEVGRPMTCGSYRCGVVTEYTAGTVGRDDSLVVIERVRSLARELEVEMGLPPAGYSMTRPCAASQSSCSSLSPSKRNRVRNSSAGSRSACVMTLRSLAVPLELASLAHWCTR